jgi:group I intron endonuclease
MRTYYIYKATNKINGKSYIGQTVSFRQRVWQHLRCRPEEDCLFHRAIEQFGRDNFTWDIIDSCENQKEATLLEKHYIKLYDTYRNGYNENKGGVGGHNARAVVCLTKNGDFYKRYDSAADTKKDGFWDSNVLECCKGLLYTCNGFQFMFEDDYKRNGAKTYEKPGSANMRSVIQCDENGNFIQKFKSLNDASKSTGANRTTISGVLSHKYKYANGFIFVYEEDFPIKDLSIYEKRKKGKRVAQIDIKTGKVIKVYDRMADAGRELGVNYKGIHKVVDMPDRTAYGYKWISQ